MTENIPSGQPTERRRLRIFHVETVRNGRLGGAAYLYNLRAAGNRPLFASDVASDVLQFRQWCRGWMAYLYNLRQGTTAQRRHQALNIRSGALNIRSGALDVHCLVCDAARAQAPRPL
eukprot:5152073-Pyramimonas_sp.AAC.1